MLGKLEQKLDKNDLILLGLFFVVYAFINFYLSSKFFPLTEGWFSETAMYILDGQIMYKDFAMYIPPVFPMLIAGLIKIFGYSFMVLRIYGILERLVLFLFIYLLLRKFFNTKISIIALLISGIFYITNLQDIFYGYYQTSLLLAVVCFYFFYSSLNSVTKKSKNLFAVLAGVFLGLLIFCKHVTGVVIAFCILAVCLFLRIVKRNKCYYKTLSFVILGALSVCLPTILILCLTGAFSPMMSQLFGGASSKGTIFDVLVNCFVNGFNIHRLAFAALFITLILMLCYKPTRKKVDVFVYIAFIACLIFVVIDFVLLIKKAEAVTLDLSILMLLPLAFLCSILLLAIYLLTKLTENQKINIFINCLFIIVYLLLFFYVVNFHLICVCANSMILISTYISAGLFWSGVVFLIYLLVCYFKKKDAFGGAIKYHSVFNYFLCFVFAEIILYIHSFSGNFESHGTLLIFALYLCLLFKIITTNCNKLVEGLRTKQKEIVHSPIKVVNTKRSISVVGVLKSFVALFCCVAMCVSLVVCAFAQRVYAPYYWWGVGTIKPITESTKAVDDPNLKGFVFEENYANELNYVYALLNETKKEGDTMYTYANINYFNVMTGLKSPTFAKVHFFDVCTDKMALNDLKVLQQTLPNFIIYCDYSERTYEMHERYYRNGNRLGQRDLFEGIKQIVSENGYQLLYSSKYISEDTIYFYYKN